MFYNAGAMTSSEPRRPAVEYLERPCKSALNPVRGMAFRWSLNPYMGCEHRCAFCYVRAYEKRADRPFDARYGRAIRVKTNVAQVLRAELARPGWRHELVVVGAATDPYQPAEGRYRLTRACLEAFVDFATPVSLITRGPMIVRDVEVLVELSCRAGLTVSFSIPTLDGEVWRRTEPGTAHPEQRLRAVARLAKAGVEVAVAMAPILPGLSDRPEQLEAVVRAARDAGASRVWAGMLHLRDGTRQHFLETLARYWPELLPRYLQEYRNRTYLPAERTLPVHREVTRAASRLGMTGRRDLDRPALPRQLSLL
jgi:DNA repair photolyase